MYFKNNSPNTNERKGLIIYIQIIIGLNKVNYQKNKQAIIIIKLKNNSIFMLTQINHTV